MLQVGSKTKMAGGGSMMMPAGRRRPGNGLMETVMEDFPSFSASSLAAASCSAASLASLAF